MTPKAWLDSFTGLLARGDIAAVTGLFAGECYWRDLVAFTWNLKTCEGRDEIRAMLDSRLASVRPHGICVDPAPAAETFFRFETAAGRGIGHLRLREGKCWTLLTALRELKDFPEKPGAREPSLGLAAQPYVVIVGGGQGGIALGARLKRLGVPALILEKNARAGDSWRKRYRSLVLHDPVWYDHMPYKPFPEGWPVFSPKDRIADWLESYAAEMQLDYWGGAPCLGASFEKRDSCWSVKTLRHGEPVTLRPKHLVLATGMSGFPNIPEIPGAASFAGTLVHSSKFAGGEGWRARQCVVVGASTSAHDICAELYENGAEATMIQRSASIVATSEALLELAWGRLYSERALAAGITTDIADLTLASVPFKVLPSLQRPVYEAISQRDKALYDGLARAGFLFDFGEDGSGIHAVYLRRGAGYYIETGASQMIVEGKIRLKSGVGLARINERSVILTDGAELPADLIVCATGYGNMSEWAAQLISPQVAAKVGKVWGLGSGTKGDPAPWEGELRNMWKPTAQPGLWFHGGNLMQARHYSLYLALQLKARMEGVATPVYG
jgi:putative flavoprotein involved in K+ transport